MVIDNTKAKGVLSWDAGIPRLYQHSMQLLSLFRNQEMAVGDVPHQVGFPGDVCLADGGSRVHIGEHGVRELPL